jgi:hypothetical protein
MNARFSGALCETSRDLRLRIGFEQHLKRKRCEEDQSKHLTVLNLRLHPYNAPDQINAILTETYEALPMAGDFFAVGWFVFR